MQRLSRSIAMVLIVGPMLTAAACAERTRRRRGTSSLRLRPTKRRLRSSMPSRRTTSLRCDGWSVRRRTAPCDQEAGRGPRTARHFSRAIAYAISSSRAGPTMSCCRSARTSGRCPFRCGEATSGGASMARGGHEL